MNRMIGVVAIFLAGLLVIPGNVGLASRVYAQGAAQQLDEKQLQELRQKRQEDWQFQQELEQRQQQTGKRRQEAEKRRQDAEKRQREAEKRMLELEQQKPSGKTK